MVGKAPAASGKSVNARDDMVRVSGNAYRAGRRAVAVSRSMLAATGQSERAFNHALHVDVDPAHAAEIAMSVSASSRTARDRCIGAAGNE